jgi:hypothetical protein
VGRSERSRATSWNLPDGEDVIFRVERHPHRYGGYRRENGKHVILISARCIGYTDSLMRTMGHEMVHLHQGDVKMETPGSDHNAAFRKLGLRVSRIHGWDPKVF